MKTTIRLFCIIVAFLSVTVSPQLRATCQDGCLTNNSTALGDGALLNNVGFDNTAIGFDALNLNTTGLDNTAVGNDALLSNTTGGANIAIGRYTLGFNTTGGANTAIGWGALIFNTTGSNNTAIGLDALQYNNTGNFNTAIGEDALDNNNGSRNVALGFRAGTNISSGSRNIDIGSDGVAGDSNTIRIGRVVDQSATFIAGISGATVPTGVAVIVDADGHLGTTTSSARFKEAVKPMDKTSEAILALQPVTFRYKHDLDPDGIPQFGLVAEDVEKVNPDLVARDEQGKPYTVRYEAVNAMLLNEFLKEHRKVEEQEVTITQLKAELLATATRQQKEIEALTAGLQKVSAQLEMTKPVLQTIANNH
jgi:hypothetical protein